MCLFRRVYICVYTITAGALLTILKDKRKQQYQDKSNCYRSFVKSLITICHNLTMASRRELDTAAHQRQHLSVDPVVRLATL